MNKFKLYALAALLIPAAAYAATTTFQTDTAKLGRPNANNKDFIFDLNVGAANPRIRANGATNKLQFSNDGSLFADIGSSTGGGGVGTNYLSDSNGQGYPSSAWTVTSGTGSADTSVYTDGLQSIKVTASSQQSKLSQDVTPTTQMSGQNWQATMWVKTALTNVQVCARVATVTTNCQPVSSANTWAPYTATFNGPASGSVGIEVSMTSSGTGTFNSQLGYVGKAFNTAMLSQMQLIGGVTISSGCTWSSTNASFATFAATTGCTYTTFGSASAPATQVPGVTFTSLPPGEYILEAEGSFGGNGANAQAVFQFWDGTNASREQSSAYLAVSGGLATNPTLGTLFHSINYSTGQNNVTIQLRSKVVAGSTNYVNVNANTTTTFKVYFIPSQQQQGFRADATPASWSGYHNLSCAFSETSASYADMTNSNSSCALVERANRNFGTVTSYGGSGASAKAGIVFTPPRAGNYLICVNFGASASTNNGSYQLMDGSGTAIGQTGVNSGSGGFVPGAICGVYLASAASTTIKIQGLNAGGTTYIGSAGTLSEALDWSIVELDAPMPAPYLVGLMPRSEVTVDSGNGHGSSNTKVLRYSNIRKNTGTAITYADSATVGGTFTINENGVYTVSPCSGVSGDTYNLGVVVNGTAGTTSIVSLTYAQGERTIAFTGAASGRACAPWTGNLSTGDVVWIQSDANGSPYSNSNTIVTVAKVSN